MPILFEWLRQEFTWRGALIISAGAFLQICPVALLMRPRTKAKHLEGLFPAPSTTGASTSVGVGSGVGSVERTDLPHPPHPPSPKGIVEDFGVEKKSKEKPLDVDIRKRIELLTAPLESEKELKRKKKESVFVQRRRERQLSVETEVLLSSSFILYLT